MRWHQWILWLLVHDPERIFSAVERDAYLAQAKPKSVLRGAR
jgi:hypothetical protein